MTIVIFIFFSSRRRHTRFKCDWSSDVCSSELENKSERAFIEMATRRSKEPITRTLRSVIHDGLAARGYTPYALDVIAPVLNCLDTFSERTRARVAELLAMALGARLRGRVQDWSLLPNEWQSIPDISLKAASEGSDARAAGPHLMPRLQLTSAPHANG